MSVILSNYNKKKKPDISIDGYVQSLPPENDIPPSWEAHERRDYVEGQRLGEITEWKNEEGTTTHYTQKKIDKKGKKYILPFTYWTKTNEGKLVGIWKTKGWLGKKCFHKSNKIPKSDLPLLVVEGEKCMHFAERDPFLSKHYLPTTWYGGVERLYEFNFEIFKGKEVILCPDNDLPGRKAMHTLAYHLVTKGITENIKYFNLAEKFEEQFPSAWDIADELPVIYKLETVLEPNSMFMANYKDVKDDLLWKQIQDEEQKRIEKETAKTISKSYCYVMANDMFNKLGSADFYQKQQLNNYHKHQIKKGSLTDLLLKDPNFARAETFITSAKFKPGLVNITKPGIIPLIQKGIDEGAKLVAGGLGKPDGLDKGYFVKPTAFADVNNQMEIARTEIFGPVLSIIPFETEEEAISIANDTPYGLTNYIQTQDQQKANRVARKLRSGMVDVNGAGIAVDAPFGGYKHSGIGREAGALGIEEFLEVKTVGGWNDN